MLVAISASGNSPNILAVVQTAHALGVRVIGLTGRTGGHLAPASDFAVTVPSDSMEIVEDAHMVVAHSLCVAVRERLMSAPQ